MSAEKNKAGSTTGSKVASAAAASPRAAGAAGGVGVSNDDTIAAVTAVYDSFSDKVDMMLAGCPQGTTDRQKIEDAYGQAGAHYQACLNKGFQDNDHSLAGLVKQATDIATAMKAIDAQLGNIATVIDTVTKAVDVTAKIAAKVVAL